jgi:hypothetical protein
MATFFMLAKIVRPLRMPSTIDVKLSSSSTSEAASRDTSEPVHRSVISSSSSSSYDNDNHSSVSSVGAA